MSESNIRDDHNAKQLPTPSVAKPPVGWTGGYFAFPPSLTPDGRVVFTFTVQQEDPEIVREREEQAARAAEAERRERLKEEAWQERLRREAQLREEQLARERAEALKGEMEWVRAGGSLRDANGRRDPVRTAEVREQVRILDEETRLLKLWDGYEARWRALLASSDPIAFAHIPWPAPTTPKAVEELGPAVIEEFLFGPLRARNNTITRRDRIRASLLRWHPDKVSGVLSRVVEEDQPLVREGVHAVFRCLKALQDSDRQSDTPAVPMT